MALERTFSIIKPDAVAKTKSAQFLSRFEDAGLKVVAAKMLHLDTATAGGFTLNTKSVLSSVTWCLS